MRIGFYGGSFDPIHIGHLILAQEARLIAGLDRVILVPAYHAPLRDEAPGAAALDRLRFCQVATADLPGLEVSDLEIASGRTCYTHETLDRLSGSFQEDELFWILGADQFERLEQWRHPETIARRVEFLVAQRGTRPLKPPGIDGLRFRALPARRIDLSSTEIRARIRENHPWEAMVPPSVADAIRVSRAYPSESGLT